MKTIKLVLAGMFIIALVATVSAFTSHEKKQTKPILTTEYYFFEVNSSGEVDTDSPLNPGDPQTLGEFEDPIGCDNQGDNDCIRAWAVGHTPTVSGPGEVTIKKE